MPVFNNVFDLFRKRKCWAVTAAICLFSLTAKTQTLIGSTFNSIRTVNLATCTSTHVCDAPAFNDICIAPNGLVYGINNFNILSVDTATGVTNFIANLGAFATCLEFGVDGFIYAMGSAVHRVNPVTGNVQVMGLLPAGWSGVGDLVFLNGFYYGTVSTPNGEKLVNINLNNPAASTIISNCPVDGLVAGGSVSHPTCPKLYWIGLSPVPCWEYNVSSGTWALTCASLLPFSFGGADTQNDYTFPIVCGCATNAGNVIAQNFTFCGTDQTVTVPFAGGEVLDPTDLLQYILFENLSDPEGSILIQSSSPNFNFDPAIMTVGQTYYLGTVAGNGLNGLVDLADTCLDFSDFFAQVHWRPIPSVTLGATNPDVCAGTCIDIIATFTGTAPFNLTYTNPATGSITQTFPGNTGTFQVCTLPGSPPGSLMVQATALMDAFCTCQ
jgi:hypothetical protein